MDYAGYQEMERMAAASEKGGRHVMEIDGRLVDGAEGGYTGAQYINP